MENYIHKVLKNGLKILFIPMGKIEMVHIELKVLCGWEHENKYTLESAHFLEHMLAKFTSKQYPDGKFNKYQLGKFGIHSNAMTTSQITSYLLEGNVDTNIISLIGLAVFFAKTFFFMFVFMWVRWTLPRFRYDQLMRLGWQALIPLAILNIIITGAVMTLKEVL